MVKDEGKSGPATVGIVVSDDAVRDSIRILLESHGMGVAAFSSADSALSAPAAGFVCWVVDQQVTGINGLELVEKLRARGDLTPAILMAAQPEAGLERRISGANTLALLIKPIQQNELIAWVHHAIHNSR